MDAGVVLTVTGNGSKAEKFYRAAAELNPQSHLAWGNLGTVLSEDVNRLQEAEDALGQSLSIDPTFAQSWAMLGKVYNKQRRFPESLECHERAVSLNSTTGILRYMLAGQYEIAGDWEKAEGSYKAAYALDPDNPDFQTALGMTKMLRGGLEAGRFFYEARVNCQGCWTNNAKPAGLVTAPEAYKNLRGFQSSVKHIVVEAEQGVGDLFQMSRYAPMLQGVFPEATITLHCPSPLVGIMKRFDGFHDVVAHEESVTGNLVIGAMSLPYLCSLYGQPEPRPARINIEGLPQETSSYEVAYCWKGNSRHGNDRFRSIPSGDFASLFPVMRKLGYRSASLQAGEEACCGVDQPPLNTWEETLAVLTKTNLLITCDTAVAHLAGSLGVKTWLLIAKLPDWRWGLTGDKTPLYPSVRLWRQEKLLEWGPVIDGVQTALEKIYS